MVYSVIIIILRCLIKLFLFVQRPKRSEGRSGIKKRGLSGREAVTDPWSIHYIISRHVATLYFIGYIIKSFVLSPSLPFSQNLKWCIPLNFNGVFLDYYYSKVFNKSFSVLSEVEAKRDRSGIKKRGLSGREAVTDLWYTI